ncbi:hypothetical protein [Paraburkholderia diazotrophica]|uniref:Uncharacterized protein n=1 Tax=Paraburkholderia diazotrophica TaxID=667676 RepID=A0A1H6TQF9_9BURK|nr:hypothetical protein [Paraburkholderia diazotrophica]SEI81496.1 hypothetical protein SAMN05192539_1004194 [Paraburkholderia diazotrophica]
MQANAENIRKVLGELAAMASQCDEAERRILARATERLEHVEQLIGAARGAVLTGGDAAQRMAYEALIAERGVLEQLIARAKRTLNGEG